MDGKNDCVLVDSQRGLYQRLSRHRSHRNQASTQTSANDSSVVENQVTGQSLAPSSLSAPGPSVTSSTQQMRYGVAPSDSPGRSLAKMFEEFVEEREQGGLGMILFGEASPLTFALEEHIGDQACFYDARPTLSQNKLLVDVPKEIHPKHCAPEDIAYLSAKGAFTLPDAQTFEAYLDAFLTRFYPLYTIVNKSELLEAHDRNTLPWIMLHGICLIGATFCDASIIHRTSHKSRAEARQSYYGIYTICENFT